MQNFKEKLNHIKAFAFDIDGVFSTSEVTLHPSGEFMRTMNLKDVYAIQYAAKKKYPIGIISGGQSEAVYKSFARLGVTDIYMQSYHKRDILDKFLAKYDIRPEATLYMGDDLPDLEVLHVVGLPTCPADAAQEVKDACIYISDYDGGKGCVRDVVEQTLKLHGCWMDKEMLNW
jgi:3-deoxy-D-manno-octulosonate 8-phosphate phosphatase (KDO 8-P phosphatase)